MRNSLPYSSNMIFDYIIVGTGPAGAVIAKLLSDNRRDSVLVLESGENNDQDKLVREPTTNMADLYPQYFWQGVGVPQQSVENRIFDWTTGRLSGGGSSVNGQQYVRPTPHALRQWENLLGPQLGPLKATESFTQLENYNGNTDNSDTRGYDGRIAIRQMPIHIPAMTEKLALATERATGLSRILDYNNPQTPMGAFTQWQLYQTPDGFRESSSTAFFSSDVMTPDGFGINGRKLRVLYKSTALRIRFKGNRRAAGIEFLYEGRCLQASARKKIIVSAGINSTQLLLLSGIGPSADLKRAGIPIIFDNPNVGKNLTNHTLNFSFFTVNSDNISEMLEEPNALYAGGAFLPNPLEGSSKDHRRIQLIGSYSHEILTIVIQDLLPESRGSIRIQSNDPLKIVLANEGLLENPADMEVTKAIYRNYIKNIAIHLSLIDPAYQLLSPTIEVIDDDEQLENFIRSDFAHNHHQQCSLRMAPLNQRGVVDQYGRVHGVQGLIVADASIFPFPVDGNTSAPSYFAGYTIAKQLMENRAI